MMGFVLCNWKVISVLLKQLGTGWGQQGWGGHGEAATARENDLDYEIRVELQKEL